MSPETIGFVMIAVMLLAIFVGFPISFTLIFLGLAFGAWGFGPKLVVHLMTLQFNNVMLEQTLAAVPLFIFMGILMEQAGLMERLFRAVQLVLASTRGALYIAVLFVSTIFAAATGIVGASVTILGIMAAKTMNRSGYDVKLAAGTITAGGTLGILIPPSIMLVVMGPVLEVPVTDLFAAAIVPGILLAFLYTAYALVRCWLNPALGPPLPEDERLEHSGSMWPGVLRRHRRSGGAVRRCNRRRAHRHRRGDSRRRAAAPVAGDGGLCPGVRGALLALMKAHRWFLANRPLGFYISEVWTEFYLGLVPPALLVGFALGSILLGWATPTEGAACGAFGALLMTLAYRKMTPARFQDVLVKTLEISVLIPVPGRGVELLRCGVLAARHADDADQHAAVVRSVADRGPDHRHGADLHPRLAARVGPDRSHHRSHPDSAAGQDGHQPDLVRHSRGGQPPDRLALAARRPVGLFPEGRGAGVGSEGYLSRHDAIHGDPVDRAGAYHIVPADRVVAAGYMYGD